MFKVFEMKWICTASCSFKVIMLYSWGKRQTATSKRKSQCLNRITKKKETYLNTGMHFI